VNQKEPPVPKVWKWKHPGYF